VLNLPTFSTTVEGTVKYGQAGDPGERRVKTAGGEHVMMIKKKRMALVVGQAFAAASLISVSASGFGQAVERVEVTGSNIPRVESETASPVTVISREEIEKSGKATVAEYLQTLGVDNAGSVPMSFVNGFAAGGAGISLRGLGASSTLVLMNGRRIASYGQADDGQKVFTDLSVIPMEAVERIEVLRDGASSIYGSDAIAGVVNVILRRDFTGTVAKATYGRSRYNDGDQKRASVTMGFGNLASDRFNYFFNIEAFKADQIFDRDRDRDWIGKGDIRPWGYDQYTQFMSGYLLPSSTVAGSATSSPVGNIRNTATPPQYQSLPGCAQFSNVTPQDPAGGCLYDVGRFRSMLPSDETYNLFGRGTWQLSPTLQAYGEASYANKKTESQTNPSGVSSTWGFPGGVVNAGSGPGAVVLGPTHPQNPFAANARLRYAAFDVGPRTSNSDNTFTRFVVGLKGKGFGWDYDTALLHSETSFTQVRHNYLRYSAVKDFLAGTNVSGLNPGLAFWRIGTQAGLNSRSLYSVISPTIQSTAHTKMQILDLKASRELMPLPGGPLSLAVGGELRHEQAMLTPQTFTDKGDIIGLGFSAYEGRKDIKAAYAEVLAPVHKTVELSAALRQDKYPNISASTTPKVGAKWTPVKQFALRGTYSEGFRAPNIPESSAGGLAAFTRTTDPVRCPGGVPASGASSADCNIQIGIITTGNPNLKPEKSKGTTFGIVWDPFPTTSLALDFWRIKRTDEINQMTVGQAVAGRGTVTRSDNNLPGIPNSGTLLAVSAPYLNSASTTTNGVDLDFRQGLNLAEYGKLTLDVRWTHINSQKRTELDGTTFEWAGTHGNCDVTNCMGTPKDRVNASLTWDVGDWRWATLLNYRGSMKNVAFEGDACASSFADGTDAPPGCKLKAFYTVDLSFRWRAYKSMELFGSVQNLFDKVAPLDPLTYGAISYNPLDISGAVGRFYNIGLRYQFN
jgi:iron complex outermembrane receptor protein